jgi:hypothetical protein
MLFLLEYFLPSQYEVKHKKSQRLRELCCIGTKVSDEPDGAVVMVVFLH